VQPKKPEIGFALERCKTISYSGERFFFERASFFRQKSAEKTGILFRIGMFAK